MRSLIWLGLKKRIKQLKTWFLIIMILIISILAIRDYQAKSMEYTGDYFDSLGKHIEDLSYSRYGIYLPNEEGRDIYEKLKNNYRLMYNTGTQIRINGQDNNYKEANRLASFSYLLFAKDVAQKEGGIREILFHRQSAGMWDNVSGGIEFGKIDFNPPIGYWGIWQQYYYYLLYAKYYNYLYQYDLEPISHRNKMGSMTFLYQYFNKIIPVLLGAIVLILTFDSINEDWLNGSMKLTLTQPFSRWKYILSKIIVGVLHSIFVIIIPVLLITIVFGFFDSFENYNYPVLFLQDGFTRFEPIPNHIEFDRENLGFNCDIGISLYSSYPKGEVYVHSRIDLIPLYEFLFFALLLTILFILFCVTLNVLISSMIKNRITSFTVVGGIILIGTVLSNKLVTGHKYNLSPFSMNNPVRILDGTYNVTALVATMILIGALLILFMINVLYFKRKDL